MILGSIKDKPWEQSPLTQIDQDEVNGISEIKALENQSQTLIAQDRKTEAPREAVHITKGLPEITQSQFLREEIWNDCR
jgi:hypothetical protein